MSLQTFNSVLSGSVMALCCSETLCQGLLFCPVDGSLKAMNGEMMLGEGPEESWGGVMYFILYIVM